MKRGIAWLAAASVVYGSPHVFSVTDDLLAYPQYEVIFSDTFISDKDAQSHLNFHPSISSTDHSSTSTSIPTNEASLQTAELSRRRPDADFSSSNDPTSDPSPPSYERMILHNKPYLCSIPQVPPPTTNQTTHAQAAQEEAAELARATDRGYDLLKSMSGSCLYFISGWWSYSFCYNAHVKQFHQLPPGKGTPIFPPVEDPATPSYVLGKFGEVRNRFTVEGGTSDKEAGLPPEDSDQGRTTDIQAKGTSSSRYLSQKLSGGTTCDLTGHPRRVEIQFHCHPQSPDKIGWIKEVSTCSYLMVVYTPRLCNDVAFLPPREERAEGIACREIVKDEDIPTWEAAKTQSAHRTLSGATSNPHYQQQQGQPAPQPIIIGGIELGAQHLVGREGRRLEPPQNINPHHHSHTGDPAKTVVLITQEPAEQGGKIKRLSDKELKELDLDPGVVEAARRELEGVAAGKGWRLEVFDTGIGDGVRELRGVVDEEGEEEEYRGDVEGVAYDGEREGEEEGSQEEYYKDEL